MALERIVLNIIPAGEMPVFHCSQYENGRPVIIDLVSSDDDAFLVPEGTTVELHCRKVDDNIVTLEPDEVDNNTVTFVSTEQLTACPGDNLCEIVLYADTDPVQTIATLNFILHVEPDPLEGGLTSETQIYNLTEQIEEITQQVIGDDYYDKTEVDDLLDDKADQATTYTKSEVDTALNLKADKATTYTKTQVDSALALKADKSDTYTKTQVDNALALKANTSDLATVATTGDYDDLLNKPTIPAAQVQSDYAQADNTQVDYIKNKPDINAMITAALLEVMPVGTESGSIATFDTEIAAPLVNVSCDVVATGGNGTPDNPNPINGYTEANITRLGHNLFPVGEWYVPYSLSNNYLVIGDTSIYLKAGTYQLSFDYYVEGTTSTSSFWRLYSEEVTQVDTNVQIAYGSLGLSAVDNWTSKTITVTLSTSGWFAIDNGQLRGGFHYRNIQLEVGNIQTAYVPYNTASSTYAIDFGQTVYGGVLDVTRGKLHVTWIKKPFADLVDVGGWNRTGTGIFYIYPLSNAFSNFKSLFTDNPKSTHFSYQTSGTLQDGCFRCSDALYFVKNDEPDIASMKTWFTNTDGFFTYELATPFDIDLTPEVISAVVGTNNIYSDTNGDTTIQFKDSIQHYIDTRV